MAATRGFKGRGWSGWVEGGEAVGVGHLSSKSGRFEKIILPTTKLSSPAKFRRPSLFRGVSAGGDGTGAESWTRATRRASRRSIRRGRNPGSNPNPNSAPSPYLVQYSGVAWYVPAAWAGAMPLPLGFLASLSDAAERAQHYSAVVSRTGQGPRRRSSRRSNRRQFSGIAYRGVERTGKFWPSSLVGGVPEGA